MSAAKAGSHLNPPCRMNGFGGVDERDPEGLIATPDGGMRRDLTTRSVRPTQTYAEAGSELTSCFDGAGFTMVP